MILTCPACGTSYVVKDGAIPPNGRQVRCAACKHSWHQDPEASSEIEQVAEPVSETAPTETPVEARAEPFAERIVPEVVAEPVPEEPVAPMVHPTETAGASDVPVASVPDEPVSTEPEPEPEQRYAAPVDEPHDVFSSWEHGAMPNGEPIRGRRNRGLLTIAILVLLIALLAAAAWFLAPRAWLSRAGLASASTESPLKLMVTSQDRQKLASGNDLVSLSGRVINPTDATQSVPALQADLRDRGGTLVYSWTIAPPAPKLPPRGSASFNAAELGVPPQATSLTLRWAS